MAKVMLVEDDNNLREIYEARLQAEGYDIVTARDGEEALVVAKAEKPELVISDVMMPKISGFEMLDIMRNTDGLKDVKIIMLTALGQSDDQERADRLGADRYLVKSQVTLEDIVKVSHELLGDIAAEAVPVQAPVPIADPEPTPQPVAVPVAAVPSTDDAQADDQLIDDAMQTLGDAAAAKPVATPPAEPVAAVMADPTQIAIAAAPAEPIASIGGTRVIVPIEGEPKKDINKLLAIETAKEAGTIVTPDETPSEAEPATIENPAAEAEQDAESSAQEGAEVEAKIEDFVAGATDIAPPPETFEAEPVIAPQISPVAAEPTVVEESTPAVEPTTEASPPAEPVVAEAPAVNPVEAVPAQPEPAKPAAPTPAAEGAAAPTPAVAAAKVVDHTAGGVDPNTISL